MDKPQLTTGVLPFHTSCAIFTIDRNFSSMSQEQKTVIVVEDEPDAAELFAEMMRVSGFRVLKTYSSTPAISLIAKELPDVVILDIMMPDISGLEVLRFMRRETQLQDTPVIVVSARSMPSDIQEGLEAGATIYLTKPVGYLDLKQAVDQVMNEGQSDSSDIELPT
jgi:CheY-like chemotaxis protein